MSWWDVVLYGWGVCDGICCLSIYVSVYMIVDCAFPSLCGDLSTRWGIVSGCVCLLCLSFVCSWVGEMLFYMGELCVMVFVVYLFMYRCIWSLIVRSPAYVVTCLRVETSSVAVSVCCACRLCVHELVRCCYIWVSCVWWYLLSIYLCICVYDRWLCVPQRM